MLTEKRHRQQNDEDKYGPTAHVFGNIYSEAYIQMSTE